MTTIVAPPMTAGLNPVGVSSLGIASGTTASNKMADYYGPAPSEVMGLPYQSNWTSTNTLMRSYLENGGQSPWMEDVLIDLSLSTYREKYMILAPFVENSALRFQLKIINLGIGVIPEVPAEGTFRSVVEKFETIQGDVIRRGLQYRNEEGFFESAEGRARYFRQLTTIMASFKMTAQYEVILEYINAPENDPKKATIPVNMSELKKAWDYEKSMWAAAVKESTTTAIFLIIGKLREQLRMRGGVVPNVMIIPAGLKAFMFDIHPEYLQYWLPSADGELVKKYGSEAVDVVRGLLLIEAEDMIVSRNMTGMNPLEQYVSVGEWYLMRPRDTYVPGAKFSSEAYNIVVLNETDSCESKLTFSEALDGTMRWNLDSGLLRPEHAQIATNGSFGDMFVGVEGEAGQKRGAVAQTFGDMYYSVGTDHTLQVYTHEDIRACALVLIDRLKDEIPGYTEGYQTARHVSDMISSSNTSTDILTALMQAIRDLSPLTAAARPFETQHYSPYTGFRIAHAAMPNMTTLLEKMTQHLAANFVPAANLQIATDIRNAGTLADARGLANAGAAFDLADQHIARNPMVYPPCVFNSYTGWKNVLSSGFLQTRESADISSAIKWVNQLAERLGAWFPQSALISKTSANPWWIDPAYAVHNAIVDAFLGNVGLPLWANNGTRVIRTEFVLNTKAKNFPDIFKIALGRGDVSLTIPGTALPYRKYYAATGATANDTATESRDLSIDAVRLTPLLNEYQTSFETLQSKFMLVSGYHTGRNEGMALARLVSFSAGFDVAATTNLAAAAVAAADPAPAVGDQNSVDIIRIAFRIIGGWYSATSLEQRSSGVFNGANIQLTASNGANAGLGVVTQANYAAVPQDAPQATHTPTVVNAEHETQYGYEQSRTVPMLGFAANDAAQVTRPRTQGTAGANVTLTPSEWAAAAFYVFPGDRPPLFHRFDQMITRENDPHVKMGALLFLSTALSRLAIITLYQNSLLFPLSIIATRPTITHAMSCMVVARAGLETAMTIVGRPSFKWGEDVMSRVHYGNIVFWMRCFMKRHKNVVRSPPILPTRYIGGCGVRVNKTALNVNTMRSNETCGVAVLNSDVLPFLAPFRWTSASLGSGAIDLTGQFNYKGVPIEDATHAFSQLAEYAQMTLGIRDVFNETRYSPSSMNEYIKFRVQDGFNTQCHRGTCLVYKNGRYEEEIGESHWSQISRARHLPQRRGSPMMAPLTTV